MVTENTTDTIIKKANEIGADGICGVCAGLRKNRGNRERCSGWLRKSRFSGVLFMLKWLIIVFNYIIIGSYNIFNVYYYVMFLRCNNAIPQYSHNIINHPLQNSTCSDE